MLLQFTVRNFRSFGEAQTLSFLANRQTSRQPGLDDRVRRPVVDNLHALTSLAVFGANASGKSNLFQALHFMARFVHDSAREGQADDPIPAAPFRLDAALRAEPSSFEIIFEDDGVRYRYGFSTDRERIHEEWLYQKRKREQRLFERDGDHLEGQRRLAVSELGRHTRPNALFLSVAAQLNNPLAKQLVRWFARLGFIKGIHDVNLLYTAGQLADETDMAAGIRQLISQMDVGITDLQVRRITPDQLTVPGDAPADMLDFIRKNTFQIRARHTVLDAAGAPVSDDWFDLSDESNGTRKLFSLAGPLIDTLRRGLTVIIDEYDARLHPLMGRGILELFNDPRTNPKGAQILVITHDGHTLDLKRMRRDQLWFVEKDPRGQSTLYALSDIEGVRNDADVHRGYLQGRYGATPRLRLDPEVLLGAAP